MSPGFRLEGTLAQVTTERIWIALAPGIAAPRPGAAMTLLLGREQGGELAAAGHIVENRPGERAEPGWIPLELEAPTAPPREAVRDDYEGSRESRGAYRVRACNLKDVPVIMRPFGDPSQSLLRQIGNLRKLGRKRVVHGALYDLSITGAGILVEQNNVWSFSKGDPVDLEIALPRGGEALHVSALIQHVGQQRIGTRYGVEFGESPGRPLRTVQRAALEYVMGRQHQDLKRRLD